MPISRRIAVVCRWRVTSAMLVVTMSQAMIGDIHAQAPQWQPVDDIAVAAETFIKKRTGSQNGSTEVRAGDLDPRHRLSYCDKPLEAFMRGNSELKARTIVGVRCTGDKPWKIYVPVDLIITSSVVVARQTLVKGHLLTADDLALVRRDVTKARNGYFGDPKRVTGQRLKTQLIAGKVLKPSMIAVNIAIERGQSVTLTVGAGQFNISMTGTAMMNGALGQRIRVRNNNSGRIVEGIVRSQEHVEILLSGSNQFFNVEPKVSPYLADTRLNNNER